MSFKTPSPSWIACYFGYAWAVGSEIKASSALSSSKAPCMRFSEFKHQIGLWIDVWGGCLTCHANSNPKAPKGELHYSSSGDRYLQQPRCDLRLGGLWHAR